MTVRDNGKLRRKLNRQARSKSQKACVLNFEDGLSFGELGANEGFQTGDEMIRTVSRENHSVVW